MHLAACIFPTEYAIGPVELATALEERGFESPLQVARMTGHDAIVEVLLAAGAKDDDDTGGGGAAATMAMARLGDSFSTHSELTNGG